MTKNEIPKLEEAILCYGWYDDAFIENPRGEECEAWTKESVAARDAWLTVRAYAIHECGREQYSSLSDSTAKLFDDFLTEKEEDNSAALFFWEAAEENGLFWRLSFAEWLSLKMLSVLRGEK